MSGRKLRLEFPGACYHVINRGNYRSDVFETDGAMAAFETTLFAACAKSGWLLHAYVIMRNHYHLAIETPAGNLVSGMHWLQTTYANRFNRFRRENGHVFQGRYKALLVEGGATLGKVCHYIHLNPACAHLVPVEQLDDYRYSSFWYLRRRSRRPSWFRLQNVLSEAGGLADTPAGWAAYAEYLKSRLTGQLSTYSITDSAMSRGWVIGSDEFKAALLKDHALIATARAWECRGAQEIRERTWEETTAWALRALGREEQELAAAAKSAPWKIAVASFVKERSQASNPWLAHRLSIGRPKYVSRLVTARPQKPEVVALLSALRGKWAA